MLIALWAENKTSCQQNFASNSILEKIKLIDEGDLCLLEDLFRNLFRTDSFAYTLFGHKPMTVGGCNFDSSISKNKKNWTRYYLLINREAIVRRRGELEQVLEDLLNALQLK